jgi:HSP20 family protein
MTWRSAFEFGPLLEWDPFRALDRAQAELDAVAGQANDSYAPGYPPLDVWTGDAGAVVTAEVPGIEPDQLDISVVGDMVKLAGSRPADPVGEGESWLRRERGYGAFERTIRLPFKVEADAVEAHFKNGMLDVRLPKAGAERTRRVEIQVH